MAGESLLLAARSYPPLRGVTLTMAGLAALAAGLAEGQALGLPLESLLIPALLCGAMVLAHRWLGALREALPDRRADGVLLAVFSAPFVLDAVGIRPFGSVSLEFLLLAGLRNVALAAAAMSGQPKMLRVGAVSSLFVVLIAFALGGGLLLLLFAAAYAMVAILWLMVRNWATLDRLAPAAAGSVAGFRLPRRPAMTLGVLAFLALVVSVLAYPENLDAFLRTLAGWTDAGSPRVDRAEQQRLAYVNRKALGALADRKYGGEAATPEQASSPGDEGAGGDGQQSSDGEARPAQQPSPERQRPDDFSLLRDRSPSEETGSDHDEVLFQAKGQGPMHLPVTTYRGTDGKKWQADPHRSGPQFSAELTDGDGWLTVLQPLGFSLDPSTPGGSARGGDLPRLADHEDSIEWSRAMARQMALQMQGGGRVVEPQTMPLDVKRLADALSQGQGKANDPEHLLTPYDLEVIRRRLEQSPDMADRVIRMLERSDDFRRDFLHRYLAWRMAQRAQPVPPEVDRLVRSWTEGKRPGWEQVQGVVQGLRNHAEHDPDATVPPDTDDPMKHFLLESRRGPDYMFASTAAILLRHLGHPSRMVGGFYVRPDAYRRLTGTTPVRSGDLHYWTQVQLPDGLWVNLEPTPGFEPARPPQPWTSPWIAAWERASRFAQQHAAGTLLVGLALVGAVLFRRRLAERAATLWWAVRLRGRLDRAVVATWRLLEHRSRLAGCPRPRGRTLLGWYAPLLAEKPQVQSLVGELSEIADWAAHAPGGLRAQGPWSEPRVRRTCREAVGLCSVSALRSARKSHRP